MSLKISRRQYAETYGPTVGDQVRLADTELFIQVERDLIAEGAGYGNEIKFGGGKVIRDGMGQSPTALDAESLDLVITNALILDAVQGVIKADIGIKGGRISAIGHAGNPGIQSGVTPGMIVGAATEVIAGEGCIVTAGGIDSHIHFICPQQIEHALASGVTTMLGGGTGPAHGTYATTCTPGRWNMLRMLEAADEYPMNLGFLGKGNCSTPEPLREQILAGAIGLKLHEDWGTTPAAIDCCLGVADELDVQVAIHTDTLNESGFVEDSIRAFKGRTIHTFHSEGAGGGHAPDIIRVCGESQRAAVLDQPDAALHRQHHRRASRHAHGLPSPRLQDPRGRGVCRIAHPPRDHRGGGFAARSRRVFDDVERLAGDGPRRRSDDPHLADGAQDEDAVRQARRARRAARHAAADNFRALRYVAKYTINPAISHGIAHEVGSIEVGKLADLVVWKPAFFGVKPEVILKGGLIACANMGDPNASIPTPQPTFYRPQFAAHGRAKFSTSVTFVSDAALRSGALGDLGLAKRLVRRAEHARRHQARPALERRAAEDRG